MHVFTFSFDQPFKKQFLTLYHRICSFILCVYTKGSFLVKKKYKKYFEIIHDAFIAKCIRFEVIYAIF